MILAAGRGERMRPLTDTIPKPLLFLGKYRLIEWQIIHLVRAGIERIVINCAWLSEQFSVLLGDGSHYGCQLIYSYETVALETAGGIIKALPLLMDITQIDQSNQFNTPHTALLSDLNIKPFIVVSGDIYTDYDYRQLPEHLGENIAHLVLVNNPEYNPLGDMGLVNNRIVYDDFIDIQHNMQHKNQLTYGNIGVFSPLIFLGLQPMTLKLFPWLYSQGSIQGEHYTGNWHNIGTPAQLQVANTQIVPKILDTI